MNQKSFVNIILVVAIVILVGAVGYFAFVKKTTPAEQPAPTLAPTQTKTPTSPTTTQQTLPTTTNNIPPRPNVKNRIVFNGISVSVGETFEFNAVPLKLISIHDDGSVLIEYPDRLWSRTPGDPGGCEEIEGKVYRGTFKEGSFLATKTCDAYTVYSFKFSQDADGTVVINTQSKKIGFGI